MKRGQSTLEYAMIVVVVVAALMAMSVYVQRSVQANLKSIEDQINAQPTDAPVATQSNNGADNNQGNPGDTNDNQNNPAPEDIIESPPVA